MKKRIIAVTVLTLITATIFLPYIGHEIELQYLYFKYPNRVTARPWHSAGVFGYGVDGRVAKAIIRHDIQELQQLWQNGYPTNTLTMSGSKNVDFYSLIFEWHCHQCLDTLLNNGGTPSDSAIVSMIETNDSYYLERLLENKNFDVNEVPYSNIGFTLTPLDYAEQCNPKYVPLLLEYGASPSGSTQKILCDQDTKPIEVPDPKIIDEQFKSGYSPKDNNFIPTPPNP